jgi:hypothetical protein
MNATLQMLFGSRVIRETVLGGEPQNPIAGELHRLFNGLLAGRQVVTRPLVELCHRVRAPPRVAGDSWGRRELGQGDAAELLSLLLTEAEQGFPALRDVFSTTTARWTHLLTDEEGAEPMMTGENMAYWDVPMLDGDGVPFADLQASLDARLDVQLVTHVTRDHRGVNTIWSDGVAWDGYRGAQPVIFFRIARFLRTQDKDHNPVDVKLEHPFPFPAVLDGRWLCRLDESVWYDLAGVVVHRGDTDSGHYWALSRRGDLGGEPLWVRCNDDNLAVRLRLDDVLAPPAGETPYVLMYVRREAVPVPVGVPMPVVPGAEHPPSARLVPRACQASIPPALLARVPVHRAPPVPAPRVSDFLEDDDFFDPDQLPPIPPPDDSLRFGTVSDRVEVPPELLTEMNEVNQTRFGQTSFRPLQAEAIGAALSGRDVLLLLPTGGGKSLCYQLPGVARPGVTVVITPLLSLMHDQLRALAARGICAGGFWSQQSLKESDRVVEDFRAGRLKFLYATPERIENFDFSWRMRRLAQDGALARFALDEVHCLCQWGADFRPAYRRLSCLRKAFPTVPIIAVTATATPSMREEIVKVLGIPGAVKLVGDFNRPNLFYEVLRKPGDFDA